MFYFLLLNPITQEVEKPGQLLSCIYELRKLVFTPIKPYTSEEHTSTAGEGEFAKPSVTAGGSQGSSDTVPEHTEEKENSSSGGSSCSSPSSSPCLHRSSSVGSDLDELLGKEFPQEDLPSLITRTIGKGELYEPLCHWHLYICSKRMYLYL